jgi:RES domain-containing protein
VIRCFRLSAQKYPSNSGFGAARYGGRWNPKGLEVLYASASVSLASLEVLVQFAVLPHDYVLTEIQIPNDVAIVTLDDDDLPEGWDGGTLLSRTQAIGRRWAANRRSAVLSVPSAIISSERNYVINPKHPDFGRIRFLSPVRFRFDPRLK